MKKNIASQAIGVQMITAADGTAFTGAVSVLVTLDNGTQTAGGGTAPAHEGNGYHSYTPTQAETNGDHIAFTFTGTGAIPATVQVYTTFPQTGDSFARLGAPAGASVSADILVIDNFVDGIESTLAAGVVLSAAGVDAIWDEPIVGHLTAGTAGLSEAVGGAAIADATITGTPTSTSFTFTGGSTSNDFYNDQTVYILSGTGIGQVRPILSSSYAGGTTTITVDEAFIVTPVAGDRAAILVAHTHPITQIQAGLATSTELVTEINSVQTDIAAIKADTDDIQTRLPAALVGGRIDASIGAIAGDTGDVTKLGRVLSGNVTFTVGAASSTTSIVTSALDPAASVADQYKGRILTFNDATTTAALRGQSSDITANTSGGVLTCTALTTAPVSGDIGTIS